MKLRLLLTVAGVETACATEIDAYDMAAGGSDDVAFFTATRQVYGCAAGVVPAYAECLPLIDKVVGLAGTDPDHMDAALDDMWTCTDDVHG